MIDVMECSERRGRVVCDNKRTMTGLVMSDLSTGFECFITSEGREISEGLSQLW